ncbi:hypothetical protein [Candidatus Methylobacter oryzae]|uniref:Uncharacterized protein n=1 Tax=Candidatus Methylobacter oryzae TaxID=2497749 RepID=A0ABY3CAX9_9GAMM|nr:hypothetical protein [Candidatus Methylobacter oryzae]TRW95546.1 hypothetical protein EKO24_009845 [Candidatus Methylobacter oryzae]
MRAVLWTKRYMPVAGHRYGLDLPGFTTARDGGRNCSRQSSAFPPSMEVRSVGAAGSGSSKDLEGLPFGLFFA